MKDKSIILYSDIPNVAKNNAEEYFLGYTYSLFRYNIITKKELRIARKFYNKLKVYTEKDFKEYLKNIDNIELRIP